MVRAADRILKCAMFGHETDGVFEIGIGSLTPLQRAAPELAFNVAAAAEREHDRQRDLAFAKVISHVLAKLRRRTAIVEHVVDQLKGDAEVHPERAAGGLLGPLPRRERWPDFASGREQFS